MDLPQELVEEIIEHLKGNFRCLKACSLVNQPFRVACQRILLHRISITPATAKRTLELFTESPHIVPYITTVALPLPRRELPAATSNAIQAIYTDSVRCCTVSTGDPCPLDSQYSELFLAFLERQPLQELRLKGIAVQKLDDAVRIIRCAPNVSLHAVSFDNAALEADARERPSLPAPEKLLQRLDLQLGTSCLGFLARAAFAAELAGLRSFDTILCSESDVEPANNIISFASSSLCSLGVTITDSATYSGIDASPLIPCPLTVLRRLTIAFVFHQTNTLAVLARTLRRLFAPSPALLPALEKLTIVLRSAPTIHPYARVYSPNYRLLLQGLPDDTTTTLPGLLDTLLTAHHARTRVCWKLETPPIQAGEHFMDIIGRQREVDRFRDAMVAAMPRMAVDGRVDCEQFQAGKE